MLTQQTMEKMNGMKLSAMAEAFEQQLGSGEHAKLSFEERVGLLVDCEWTAREQRKLTRRLRAAKPRSENFSTNLPYGCVLAAMLVWNIVHRRYLFLN